MTALKEDLDFLAHFGKKGMKWGVRRQVKNTALAQKRIDRIARVADGSASAKDRVAAYYLHGVISKKSARYTLSRAMKAQKDIANGKKKVTASLAKLQGIRVSELNMHQKSLKLTGNEKRAWLY